MKEWDGPAQPELRAKLRALIEASAAIDRPTADDRQRVRARVAAAIAAAAPAPAPKASAADGGQASQLGPAVHIGFAAMVKHSLLAMVLGAAVTGAVISARSSMARHAQHVVQRAPVSSRVAAAPEATPPSAAAPEPAQPAQPSAATPQAPAPAKREHRPHAPRSHVEPKPPAAPLTPESAPVDVAARSAPLPPPLAASTTAAGGSSLSEELALMMTAQRALAANQLSRALTLLDQHQKRFPSGALVPERLAARAVALCRSQRPNDGARELQKLVERAPNSPLISWARADCRNVPR